MSDAYELWEYPKTKNMYLLAGWRQWADAGAVSSGLPQYLIQQTGARLIGRLESDDFYLFQFPGTHDFVRPVIKYDDGYPEILQTRRNEFYYAGDEKNGIIIFIGDEPHLQIERYISSLLNVAIELKARRIVGLGGVYGELPYEKERLISAVYSLRYLKPELEKLAVSFSDYHGGASIGSYLCKRAGENNIEYISMYAFVPTYDFTDIQGIGSAMRIENDFTAWFNVMQRVNYLLRLGFDLSDLEEKSQMLIERLDKKVEELDSMTSQNIVRDYMKRLSDDFTEVSFNPLEDIWEEEIRRLFNKLDE